jgi:hypothetical protein
VDLHSAGLVLVAAGLSLGWLGHLFFRKSGVPYFVLRLPWNVYRSLDTTGLAFYSLGAFLAWFGFDLLGGGPARVGEPLVLIWFGCCMAALGRSGEDRPAVVRQ